MANRKHTEFHSVREIYTELQTQYPTFPAKNLIERTERECTFCRRLPIHNTPRGTGYHHREIFSHITPHYTSLHLRFSNLSYSHSKILSSSPKQTLSFFYLRCQDLHLRRKPPPRRTFKQAPVLVDHQLSKGAILIPRRHWN